MKIVVSGSREWTDTERIRRTFERVDGGRDITLIHGGCRGLDLLAGRVAKEKGWEVTVYPAEWDKYGKSAGPIRNRQMLDTKPDLVIWFHDDLGNSKGTKDLVNEAVRRRLNVLCGSEE